MVAGLFATGCVDNDFDEPEKTLVIDDSTVMTIEDVLALLDGESDVLLGEGNIGTEDMYIKGTVTADDASGNFFKTVVFQDATGALSIIPDRNELNAEFPEGNIVYVKLNGLTLANNNNLPQLGFGLDGNRLQRIPDVLVNDFLIAGGAGADVTPIETTIRDIQQNPNEYYNKLIMLPEVEFAIAFVGQSYADADNPDGPQTINAIIEDCDDNEIILRNSGFSDFASDIVPQGKGSLVSVMSVFGDDLQLFIRDTDDVAFGSERCDGSGGQANNEITIQSIQDRFYELGADESEAGFISGTVISDRTSGQVNAQNIFIQNGEDGILVRFTGQHSFDLGDELKITVSGQELSEFRGLLQINNVPTFNAEKTGEGALPEPKELSVADILADNNTYEATRVVIKGATLNGGSTFAGNVDVNDGSGTISIFTFDQSSYANEPIPSGNVDVVAIVSQFNENAQLVINGVDDITGGTTDPGGNMGDEITIQSIQDRFYDLGGDQSEEGFITGVVISDRNSGQVNNQNIFIQNGEDGILVRFGGQHSFDLGDELKIFVTGQELSEFRGLLQINNVPLSNASVTGTASLPAPREISVADLLADNNTYESTRVLIKGAMLDGGASFAGNVDVSDGTGTISIFTFDQSSYANEAVPSGEVNVTAIVSQFNDDAQLVINGLGDVSGGTVDPGGNDGAVNADFEGQADFDPIDLEGWLNIATKGARVWYFRSFDNNGFAECEAFQDENPETEAWLVTPTIDTDDKSILSFETAQAFWQHQGLSVWISPNFNDLSDANWTELTTARIANNGDEQYTWVSSGDIDLTDFLGGNVRVGWKYEGTESSNTTKMRIDNVVLK